MENPSNPFDKGFTGFYLECLVLFQERGKPLSQLPLYASLYQIIPKIKPDDTCSSDGKFIYLGDVKRSSDINGKIMTSGKVKSVNYRLIGTTSNLQIIISDNLEYEYAMQLLKRMQDLLKEAARSLSINTIHISREAYQSLIKTAIFEQAEKIDKVLIKLKFLGSAWSFIENDGVIIQLNNLPWSDSNLQMTVGYNRQSLQENLNILFEKSLVDLLMLAGEAGVKQIKLDPLGSIIKGLQKSVED